MAKARELTAAGRFGEALAALEAAQGAGSADPELVFARACTLHAWGRMREAHAVALRAEALGLRRLDVLRLLGLLSFHIGRMEDAERWMREALAIDAEGWQSHLQLAVVLKARQKTVEAAAEFERALALHADDFDSLIGLGGCRLEQGDTAAAEAVFRRTVTAHPGRSPGWNHLGVALGLQVRPAEAAQAFEEAARLERATGESADALVNLAINLREDSRTEESLPLFAQVLAQGPGVFASCCYAYALLKAGHFARGWSQYEFRWYEYPLVGLRPRYPRPVWAGHDLAGKTILLHQEQGLGDTIQFVRYAPHLKALGAATVLLRVEPSLYELAQGFSGVDHVLAPTESNRDFDFWIPTLGLPRAFATDLDSIPAAIPYLATDPARTERWAPRFRDVRELKVGIAWAGSPLHKQDRHRSVSLDAFARLGAVSGVRFYSIQKGPPADALATPRAGFEPVNLGPELNDFCDTAAVISHLDLVICVDTAVAHLAGALGKPVWILIGSPPDFRWLEEREDSPWYPTARLFRQKQRGDWDDVIERVKAALAERVRDARPAPGADPMTSARSPVKLVPVIPVPGRPLGLPEGYSTVAETRHGIVQYFPHDDPRGVSIDWYGEYVEPQVDALRRMVRPGAVVVEADAGEGIHALALAAVIGDAGHLMLYETRPVVRRMLSQNLAANKIGNATVMRGTLGAPPAAGSDAEAGAETETLDDLHLERLDWLKVNDGAAAPGIFDGAANTLWRLRPCLFVCAQDAAALTAAADRAKEFGYRCWKLHTPLFDPRNFNRRNADIFGGRAVLALLAIPEEFPVEIGLDGLVEL